MYKALPEYVSVYSARKYYKQTQGLKLHPLQFTRVQNYKSYRVCIVASPGATGSLLGTASFYSTRLPRFCFVTGTQHSALWSQQWQKPLAGCTDCLSISPDIPPQPRPTSGRALPGAEPRSEIRAAAKRARRVRGGRALCRAAGSVALCFAAPRP